MNQRDDYQMGDYKKFVIFATVITLLAIIVGTTATLWNRYNQKVKKEYVQSLNIDIPIGDKDTTTFNTVVQYDQEITYSFIEPDTNTQSLEFCDPKLLINTTIEWYEVMFDIIDELIRIDSVGVDSTMKKHMVKYIKNGNIVGYRYPSEREK